VSVHIIELNDRSISLRNQNEVLVQSPGFANIADKTPVFGEPARNSARLHPRHTYSQFWSQLSLDPLVNSNNHFRHQADLAFAHLNDIANQHALKDDVIFAVPSNYNRNQLSILLGLVQSCEFDAAGLVDMPLLMSGNSADPDITVYLDIQLHQSVLTTFTSKDGKPARDKVIQIPGTGLIALHDSWVNMLTDEFIKQSRFDPHHNAETEQYVYNQLEDWLKRSLHDNEILMEINNKGSVYQAKINRGHFEQRSKNIFARIKSQLESLVGNDSALHLPEAHANLPGLSLYLNNITTVKDSQLLENTLSNLDHIKGEPGSLNLVASLPASKTGGQEKPARSVSKDNVPSHILINHRAYTLPVSIHYGPVNNHSSQVADNIFLEASQSGQLNFSLNAESVQLDCSEGSAVELNGNLASATEHLKLGDVICVPGAANPLQFIQVE